VYYINKTPENWNISESVFTIRPNNTVSSEFMYLLLLSDELQNYVQQHAQGSAQKGIRMADFKKYKLLLPNIGKMEELSDMWRPLINQSKLLDEENNRFLV
jgi:type I restriction enzyme S subunit